MAVTIDVKNGGPCRKILDIKAGWEDVSADYSDVLGAFARQAEIPGFRKGKAPSAMVARRYARAIADETRDYLIGKFYRKAVEQEQLKPLAIVDVADASLKHGEGFTVKVTVDIPPDFSLPRYRKIPVKATPPAVTDAQVEEAYARFLDRFSRFEEVSAPRPVAKGDLALIDYAGTCDGKPMESMSSDCRDIGVGRDAWVLVDTPEFLPGIADGLAGMGVGESRTVPVTFPAEFHVKSVAGKHASYTVTVKQLREKKPVEVDEKFLKEAGVESVEQLKKQIREQMTHAAIGRDLSQRREQIARFLLSETKIDVPPSVVEQELQMTVRGMVRNLVAQGGTREQIAEHRASIMDAATRTSLDRVKLGYILARIAEEEKVGLTEKEVDDRIAAMAVQLGSDPAQLRAMLEKRNGLEGLRAELREEKAMELLVDNAKVQE